MTAVGNAPASSLGLDDACALAAAWVSHVGERCGIRLLVIKGQSLAHHGLRPARTSADVDVLVEPPRFDELCAQVLAAGWRQRATTEIGAVAAGHSLTFLSDTWPCDIDVHRYFPGFLNDPAATFDLLWESRTHMGLAHRPVAIPSRAASILIAGLHQLRDGETRADRVELATLARARVGNSERAGLIELARATGALEPARGLLARLGIMASDLPPARDSPSLRLWRARIDADASGAYFWMLLLKRTPPRERFKVLLRAVWLPRADLLIDDPAIRDTLPGRARARLARIPRGLLGLPRATRAMFSYWRKVSATRQ